MAVVRKDNNPLGMKYLSPDYALSHAQSYFEGIFFHAKRTAESVPRRFILVFQTPLKKSTLSSNYMLCGN